MFIQCIITVKVHRVFPSNCKYSASSRKIQLHWDNTGDSREVVTPFMRVENYSTRNFATIGPSRLQPSFTGTSIQNLHLSFSSNQHRTGIRPYTSCCHFAESCVFIKQSLPSLFFWPLIFKGTLSPEVTESFCRVPSISFTLHLNILYQLTCVGLSTVFLFPLFTEYLNFISF